MHNNKNKNINLSIVIDDKIEKISINELDTVEHLYNLLCEKINKNKDNLSWVLGYEYEYLTNKNSLIIKYNFSKICNTLNYIISPFYFFVKTMNGMTIYVICHNYKTVDYAKSLIQKQLGFAPDEQRLIFEGKQLEGNRTLSDYNIKPGSTLHLAIRLRG